jgi:hypothetical protein
MENCAQDVQNTPNRGRITKADTNTLPKAINSAMIYYNKQAKLPMYQDRP